MTLEIGSKVLKLACPWGQPGEVRHIDGDTVWVAWGDGRIGSIAISELCGAENITKQDAKKVRAKCASKTTR